MASVNLVLAYVASTLAATTVMPPGDYMDSTDFFNSMCVVLAEDPGFELEKLFDLWMNNLNWNTREVPFDLLVFIRPSISNITRFRQDMGKLLVREPPWATAAALMVDQQQDRLHRMTLLFPVEGKPGRFLGVPNFRAVNSVVYIKKKSVYLIDIQMVMLANSSYLIIMDCDTGETSLSHRDTLDPVYTPAVYQAGLRVPLPVRYSWMYTGQRLEDIPPNHPPEPIMVQ